MMTINFYQGGLVRSASEVSPEVLAKLQGNTPKMFKGGRSSKVLGGGKFPQQVDPETPPGTKHQQVKFMSLDINEIDLDGALPGDPFPHRLYPNGSVCDMTGRAKKTERRRRQVRAQIQAALASGEPIPMELQDTAMVLLRKGRFEKRRYVPVEYNKADNMATEQSELVIA